MNNLNYQNKKMIIAIVSTAMISSLVTYYATKTNYQEQYYSQMLEEKVQEKIQQDKLGTYKKLNYGNEKAY
ncbi:MAG: hypothetical protein RLZZ210_643 [Pseudomonadota bacterium]|jgi:hypothetical protein